MASDHEGPALNAADVTVQLAGTKIIDEVSVRASGGEFVGIVGPNGSGKSTLLKALYKVLSPSDGEIHLGDLDLRRSKPAQVAKQLAVISQFNEASFNLNVREMVTLGRNAHLKMLEPGSARDREIVEAAIDAVGLRESAELNVQVMSGGERQRVALARALAQEPRFLILDEPTNHLDIRHQLQVLDIVQGLGVGVLAALHDLHLAARYCDRVYVIKSGRIVASGTPQEVLTAELISQVYGVECNTFIDPRGHLGFVYSSHGAPSKRSR